MFVKPAGSYFQFASVSLKGWTEIGMWWDEERMLSANSELEDPGLWSRMTETIYNSIYYMRNKISVDIVSLIPA